MKMALRTLGQALLIVIFVFIVFEIVMLSPSQMKPFEENKEEIVIENSDNKSLQAMKGVHLVEVKNDGEQEWELWADEAIEIRDKEDWNLKKVKIIFFGEENARFVVTGNEGQIMVQKKNVLVSGKVLTESSNGYKYWADEVRYDSPSRLLMSDGPIELLAPPDRDLQRMRLVGVGMATDLNSGKIEVHSYVNAKQVIREDQIANIKSDKAEFSGKSRFAKFLNNTIIDISGMRVTGPEAELIYGQESERVEILKVRGGAKVSDVDKWATSKDLVVYLKEDKFLFSGNPKIVQGEDELVGQEIIFLNGGAEVQVKGVKAKLTKKNMEKELEPISD